MSVRVWFDGKTAQDHPGSGRQLQPGVNEVDDAAGVAMVQSGIVRPATPTEVKAAEKAAADAAEKAKQDADLAVAKAKRSDAAKAKAAEERDAVTRRALGLEPEPPKPPAQAEKEKG